MMSSSAHALAADTVFDGAALHRGHAVVISGSGILALRPTRELPTDMPVQHLPGGAWLAPGFIDVQVNGGGDALFNDAPTPEAILTIAAAHRRFGTTALLPTLITDTAGKMQLAAAAAAEAMRRSPSVIGIHFEGPFLSPQRAGVHDPMMFRLPSADEIALLTASRPGVTLVTLAPECVPDGFTAMLTRARVRVALGHSMATCAETQAAIAEGLTGFTHLFNAMRPISAREPGPIAAALDDPGVFYGLIVDGHHVAPANLRLALHGRGHAMLVTDAMPPVGGCGGDFVLAGKPIAVRDGICRTADGTLAGSVLDMATAVRNCVHLLGTTLPEALRLAAAAPAAFLGLEDQLGHLTPGHRADIVALDPSNVRVLATWVAGVSEDAATAA
jgi:N-acetylglucosamine-6-phosphate deacetylase